MATSVCAMLAAPIPRLYSRSLAAIAIVIPVGYTLLGPMFAIPTSMGFYPFVGAPFLILAVAALCRQVSATAWGLVCVGLVIVTLLYMKTATGFGPTDSLKARLDWLALTQMQYVATFGSVFPGVVLDILLRKRIVASHINTEPTHPGS